MRRVSFIVSIFFVSLSGGCATIMTGGGHGQSVRFDSDVKGAMVVVDGNYVGKTPLIATLTRRDDHWARVSLAGYPDQVVAIKATGNGWIFGNLLVGGAIGLAVDLCSGAMEGVLVPNDVQAKFLPPPVMPRSLWKK